MDRHASYREHYANRANANQYDPYDYDAYGTSESFPATHHFPDEYDMYHDDVDELLNDIANSSPSPPDRSHDRSRSQALSSSYQTPQPEHRKARPQYAHHSRTTSYYCESGSGRSAQSRAHESAANAFQSQALGPPESSRMHMDYQERGHISQPRDQTPAYNDRNDLNQPRNWHGTRLKPVSDLPDIYRSLFKFGVFNAVQSQCYDTVMHSDQNMVISAPTGSGKTVLFELAIIKLLRESMTTRSQARCVYIAPTKSLCAEKTASWEAKFTPFGAKCSELTGDTVHSGRGAWGDAKDATIIVTTGEKWDSLTRNWEDYQHILSQIQLFLIDEVHLLNESRGSTLEVVVSRMKLRGTAVRFVVVSATVPNIGDVADWIGNRMGDGPATVKEFGEEFRPCKLSKFVYGVPRRRDTNDFVFAKALDYRLYGILQQHCDDKPVLVFCATRKGVIIAAEHILKEYEEAISKKETPPWSKPARIEHNFSNKQLDKLAAFGIGVHHAGLGRDDRSATEQLYLKKVLKILFATSTLAVGVNLPAHTVVIKGVKLYQNNASQEYSDLDIMQMIGRAGRPQFDKEGVAIIMCEKELEAKYQALAQGQTVLESSLHLHLPEHLNSEIALGTITDMGTAKEWLHNSFLFRRLQQNPDHYDIKKEGAKSWEDRMDDLVTDSVKALKDAEMVSHEQNNTLHSTEYGDIMSKFYIRQETIILILKLSDKATVREILEILSCAAEFSDIKLRAGEKQVYNKLRTHNDIRYTIKKIEKASDKVFILIQAILSAINLSDPEYKTGETQPYTESIPILRHISRIARAVVEVAIMRKAGLLAKNALEVMRCLNAKAWEDRSVIFRQLDDIGLKSLKVLAEHNVTTFAALRKMDPALLESYLNRKPPFGHDLLASVNQLPQYTVAISEIDVTSRKEGVEVELSVECGLIKDVKSVKSKKAKKQKRWDMTLVLTLTSDNVFVDFRRISTAALKESRTFEVTAILTRPSQTITVYMSSDTYAGLTVSASYKPKLDASAFPIMDTRPQDALARDLEGLEDIPDFWDMSGDDSELDEHAAPKSRSQMFVDDPKHPASSESHQKLVEVVSTITAAPRQLSNGNFECNHTCKDKTKCKHLCCRDGLEKPPPMTKKRVEMLFDAGSSLKHKYDGGKSSSARPKPKAASKSAASGQPNRSLKQLEDLHERVGVEKNLQLSDGDRIKLKHDLASQTKPVRKIVPHFDMEFTRLGGPPQAPTPRRAPVDLSGSDDDLPEPGKILDALKGSRRGKNAFSSDSVDYANSEIDALIASLPLPADDALAGASGSCSGATGTLGTSDTMDWAPTAPPRKRKQVTQDSTRPAKKGREASSAPPIEVFSSPDRSIGHKEPLFQPDSLSDEMTLLSVPAARSLSSPATSPAPALVDDEEGFTLDTSLFDIIPSTPPLTDADYTPHVESQPASIRGQGGQGMAAGQFDQQTGSGAAKSFDDEGPMIDDPLAELEAWLQSGAVEIGGDED